MGHFLIYVGFLPSLGSKLGVDEPRTFKTSDGTTFKLDVSKNRTHSIQCKFSGTIINARHISLRTLHAAKLASIFSGFGVEFPQAKLTEHGLKYISKNSVKRIANITLGENVIELNEKNEKIQLLEFTSYREKFEYYKTMNPKMFIGNFIEFYGRDFDEKTSRAIEKINSSYFIENPYSKIVLNISAIESIIEQRKNYDTKRISKSVVDYIYKNLQHEDPELISVIVSRIKSSHIESITQSFQRNLNGIIPLEHSKKLYDFRSKIVHSKKSLSISDAEEHAKTSLSSALPLIKNKVVMD